MRTLIHVFLPSFAKIGKSEITKRMRGIHHEKRLVFCPVVCGFWTLERSRQNFIGYCFLFPISLPSFVQIRSVSEENIRKCLPDSLQYQLFEQLNVKAR